MRARTTLTDIAIRKLAVPSSGQADTWDAVVPGFGIRISKGGSRSFVFLYRYRGTKRRVTLGRYPETKLAEARAMAQEALVKVKRGIDPQGHGSTTDAITFEAAVSEFVQAHCGRHNRASTAYETERLLNVEFVSLWRNHAFREIRKSEVLAALDRILDRGTPSAANHAFAAVRKLFNWGVGRGYLDTSPCLGISRPAKNNSRDKVLTADELRILWSAAEDVGYPFGAIFQLLALTAQRRGEVAGMCWSDVNLAEATWTIPAEATKNGRQHTVPLPRSALRILTSLPRLDDRWVFPARGATGPYAGFSKAKRKLDALANTKRNNRRVGSRQDSGEVIPWTLHDLRRTAATGMGRLGVAPHVVERVLNHSSGQFKGVAGIYNRFQYLPEMREGLAKWEAELAGLLDIGVSE